MAEKPRKTFGNPSRPPGPPRPVKDEEVKQFNERATVPLGQAVVVPPPGGAIVLAAPARTAGQDEFEGAPTRVDIRAYRNDSEPEQEAVVLPPMHHDIPTAIAPPSYHAGYVQRPPSDAPTAEHALPPDPYYGRQAPAQAYPQAQPYVQPGPQYAQAQYTPHTPHPAYAQQAYAPASDRPPPQGRPVSNRPPPMGYDVGASGSALAVSQETRVRIVQPKQEGPLSPSLVMLYAAASPAANQFRLLRYRIEQEPNGQLFAIASPSGGEGCTTVAANLALALAEGGRVRVLLVDLRLREPAIAKLFGLSNEDGISTMLARVHRDPTATFDVVAVAPSFFLLPAGPPATNPYSVLASDEAARMVGELRREFRYVIVDSGPILPGAEGLAWQGIVEHFLIVAQAGRTTTEELQQVTERIRKDKILGVVMNGRQGKKAKKRR